MGLVAMPTKQEQKSLLSPIQPLTPYIQTDIQKPILKTNKVKTLVDALILVESAGNPKAFNKKENACGCLQIRRIMLREVNRILRKQNNDKRFTKEDRWSCGLSQEMFYIWRNVRICFGYVLQNVRKSKGNHKAHRKSFSDVV